MSELPRMYHNKIDKDLNNNERVFSTLDSNNIYTNTFCVLYNYFVESKMIPNTNYRLKHLLKISQIPA